MYELWNKLGVKQYYKLTAVQQGPVAYWIWYWVHTNALRVQLPVVTSVFSSQKASFRASAGAPFIQESHAGLHHIRKNIRTGLAARHSPTTTI